MPSFTSDETLADIGARFAHATRAEQGLPPTVEDRRVLLRWAATLSPGLCSRDRAARKDTPVELNGHRR